MRLLARPSLAIFTIFDTALVVNRCMPIGRSEIKESIGDRIVANMPDEVTVTVRPSASYSAFPKPFAMFHNFCTGNAVDQAMLIGGSEIKGLICQ